MAPRKQAKQAAAESTQIAAADGNVTPPKKRKTAAKSTAPKQAKTAAPRQVRQVKAQEAAAVFSPKNLRSRQKDVAPKNENAENKSKKMFANKEKEEKKTVEDDMGKQVEKKTRGGGKSAVTKKAGTKTATAKPKAKTPVVKKKKDQVENGAGNIGNGIVSDENPPKRATRRGKAADEENVGSPAATKVRVIKKPRKRKTAETEAIAEADDEESPGKNDAEMIVDNKKSREKAKKTAKAAVKEKKDSTKISKGKRNVEKEIKDVEKEEDISKNLALESVDENDTSVDKSNNVSHNENNKAEITIEIKDDEENINGTTAFERSATFMLFE